MQNELFFSHLIDHLSTALVLLDQSLEVTYLNNGAERTLGCSLARAQHQTLCALCKPPEGFTEHLKTALEQHQPVTLREARFFIHGEAKTLDLVVTPIEPLQDQQNSKKHQGLLIEITPLDRFLKISKEEQQADHHKASRLLIKGIAHEVKNPLGGIRGASQLLEKQLNTEQKEYTQLVIHEVDRLSSLVDRILGPDTPVKKQLLNVHQVLERCIRLIEAEYQHTIVIERHYDLSLPEIDLDLDRSIQAILNICSNAAQALSTMQPPHLNSKMSITTRIARQVTLNQKRYRHAIEILIEDNGPGIPEHLKDSVFYPFITSRSEGTGIGLSVAQHIVQEQGGSIEFESTPGHTLFRCFFPVNAENTL